MQKELARIKISTWLNLAVGLVFIVAAILVVLQVNRLMRQQALVEAESKARILLDRNMAIHTYFTRILKPRLFQWTDPFRPDDYFDPGWMSSTYAVRQIDEYFRSFSPSDYYIKDSAVNARSPENEADAYERAFLDELWTDPTIATRSEIRTLDGVPYYVLMRRGEVLEETCLRCHGDPNQAPAGLVRVYGAERSFHRENELGKVVSAISIRVPLSAAYAEADRFSMQLAGFSSVSLAGLFLAQLWLNRRLLLAPLAAIRGSVLQVATDESRLGEQIPVPAGQELSEMATAFNTMSAKLRHDRDRLEERVEARTADLATANIQLEGDITERVRVEAMLRESEIRYRELFENMNSGVAVYTVIGNGQDFIFKDFNRAGERIDHDQRERLIGKSIFEVRPGVERFGLIEVFRQVWQTGEPAHRPVTLYQDGNLSGWYENFVYRLPSGEIVAVFEDVTERKQEEEARRVALVKYQTLFDSFPLGITVADSAGKIREGNLLAEKLLGLSQEEQFRRAIDAEEWRLVRPDGTPMPAEEYASVRALKENRRVGNVEMGIVKPGGEITWISVTAAPLPLEGYGVVIAYDDITERKRAEAERQALLEIMRGVAAIDNLQELLELIRQSLAQVIYAENFFVVFHNRSTGLFEEVFAVDKNDAPVPPSKLERSITAYVFRTGESLLLTRAKFEELQARGEVELVGTQHASWLGAPLKTPTAIIGVIAVQNYEDPNCYSERDREFLASVGVQVSLAIERRRAEEALREREEKYRNLFNNAEIAMFRSRLDGSETLEVNRKFLELVGWTREETLGKPPVILWADPKEREEMVKMLVADGRVSDFEFRMLHKEKGIRNCITSLVLYLEQGLLEGSIADITERKQAEQRSFELAVERERTALLTKFIVDVSHEFRTPLSIMQASVYLLGRLEDPAERRRKLAQIGEQATGITRLVDLLVEMARLDSGVAFTTALTDLNQVVGEIAGKLQGAVAAKGLTLHVELAPDLPPVAADGNRLGRALHELLDNAVRFTPAGGTITVRTGWQMADSRLRMADGASTGKTPESAIGDQPSAIGHPRWVAVEVRDTGPGIPSDALPRIFERFYRRDVAHTTPGFGLGLPIARAIVERLGGRLEVESEEEAGSLFRIVLPEPSSAEAASR